MIPQLDLASSALRSDPYPTFARLRAETPVVLVKNRFFGDAHYLTRYADCAMVLTDKRFANDRRNVRAGKDPREAWWMPPVLRAFRRNMVASDEPDHRRLRDLVHQAFTPRRIEELHATIERIVDDLLTAAARKQHVDLIADFALPLPMTIISEMMGVPENERATFRRQMRMLFDGDLSKVTHLLAMFPKGVGMMRFFHRLIRLRREQPQNDLITALVQAEAEGSRLDDDELVSMIFVLLLAGHETTVNLIGSGMLALLQHPDQLERLRAEPALLGTAIEELLRFANPVQGPAPRFAREDVAFGDVVIPRGATVVPLLGSANRDERAFENADQLDVGRTPNRHLAFGLGIHYCLGAPLARMEGKIAFQRLLERFPHIALEVPASSLGWRGSVNLRGLRALPLQVRTQGTLRTATRAA